MAKDLNIRFKVTDEGTILLDKISQKISGIDESAKKMSSSLSLIKLDSLINLGERAYRAGERVYSMAKSIADAGNEIQRNSRIVGMGTEEYQRWTFAAKMSDVEAGSLSAAMRILSRNMEETSQGTGEAKEYFDAMGISVKDASGKLKPLGTIMKEIAGQFSRWEEGPQKIAIAMRLMGRSAEDVIPLFNQGAEGIEALGKKAIIASDQQIEAASKWEEKFKLWEDRFKSWKFQALDAMDKVIEGVKKTHALTGSLEFSLAMGLRKKPELPEYPQYEPGSYYGKVAIPPPTPNKEAADVFKKALEKAAEYEAKMNQMFPDDAYNLKMAAIEAERIANADKDIAGATKGFDNLKMLKVYYEEGKLSVIGYVRAMQEALDIQKKLTDEDYYKAKTDALIELEDKSRAINRDEEGWQKKQNALIDQWLEKTKEAEKLRIPTHADVSPMEKEVADAVEKLNRTLEITIKTKVEAAGGGEGVNVWGIPAEQFFSGGGVEGNANINIFGIGSTKKPITEKIKEIIGEFGGLEKALSGMEAEINLAEFTSEYKALENKLKQVERILPDMSAMASRAGGSPYVGGPIVETVKDLTAQYTEQMKLLQMKMNYEAFRAYGGEAQTGIGYVPRTALYKLHEGERVLKKNVSIGDIHIHVEGGQDVAQTLIKTLKYRLSNELRGLL